MIESRWTNECRRKIDGDCKSLVICVVGVVGGKLRCDMRVKEKEKIEIVNSRDTKQRRHGHRCTSTPPPSSSSWEVLRAKRRKMASSMEYTCL